MKKIAGLVGHELKWTQPQTLQKEYELRDDDSLVGTLRFRSSLGSFATAESGDGCWTFKRAGFLQARVIIRDCGADPDLAVFRNSTWNNGGTLELPDGRRYPANCNFWMTTYEFKTEDGESLVNYRRIGGLLHLSSHVEILPAAVSVPELPWIVILGWYLTVMLHSDSAAGAAAAAG